MTSLRRQIVDNVVAAIDAIAEIATVHKWKQPAPELGAGPYACVAAMTERTAAQEGGFTIKQLEIDVRVARKFDSREDLEPGWDLLEVLILKVQEKLLEDVNRGLPAAVEDTEAGDYSIAPDSEAATLLVARLPVLVTYTHQFADLEAAP